MPIESSIESPAERAIEAPAALAPALAEAQVDYCRWSGPRGRDGESAGGHDVDLLVSRAHIGRMAEVLARLGFKCLKPAPGTAVAGVLHTCAYDAQADNFVNVHAHQQLILGPDPDRAFRLPFEQPYLASGLKDGVFREAAPEYEFVLFVLQSLLQPSALGILLGRGKTAHSARGLGALEARVDMDRVQRILKRDLPHLGDEIFAGCLQALRPGAPAWRRLKARRELVSRSQAPAGRPPAVRRWLQLFRTARSLVRRPLKDRSKHRLQTGGAVIAIVGGDGSGKTTLVEGLRDWLSSDFSTTNVHLGKPRWSLLTAMVRGILKAGQLFGLYPPERSFRKTLEQTSPVSPGYPWLLREVCRARDRYAIYVRARRMAAKGGLVISDRFPLPQIRLMDGPQARSFLNEMRDRGPGKALLRPHRDQRLARALVRLEESYYQRMAPPEVLIVLRVDPEIAVARRTGEDLTVVRERCTEIWQVDWQRTRAYVIDASRARSEVLAAAKAFVWSQL